MWIGKHKLAFAAGLVLLLTAISAQAQQVVYVVDALGRLVAVIDQQGRTAIYTYDAVGNILGIQRQDAVGPVAITFVNPSVGRVGAQVQIFGAGFSTDPAQNQIAFNGAPASVLAASPNGLATTVPAGATTGPLTVTTPLGSATSAQPFVIVEPIAIETITLSGSPTGVAVHQGLGLGVVARQAAGLATLLDLATRRPLTHLAVGGQPSAVGVSQVLNQAFVANAASASLTRLNLQEKGDVGYLLDLLPMARGRRHRPAGFPHIGGTGEGADRREPSGGWGGLATLWRPWGPWYSVLWMATASVGRNSSSGSCSR